MPAKVEKAKVAEGYSELVGPVLVPILHRQDLEIASSPKP